LFERSEVVFLERIVVGCERVEALDLLANRELNAAWQGTDAFRLDDAAGHAHGGAAQVI
jgi:hypothetical protein